MEARNGHPHLAAMSTTRWHEGGWGGLLAQRCALQVLLYFSLATISQRRQSSSACRIIACASEVLSSDQDLLVGTEPFACVKAIHRPTVAIMFVRLMLKTMVSALRAESAVRRFAHFTARPMFDKRSGNI